MSQGGRGGAFAAGVAAWWSFLVLDFLTYAVFLASWWRASEAYWLSPVDLFKRIPIGYASFAVYCVALTWLLVALHGNRATLGTAARFGAVAGFVFGLTGALGGYSATRMPGWFLLVGPAVTTVESAAAAAAAAWVMVGERPWRRVGLVVCAGAVMLVAGILIQNVFFPTPADYRIPAGGQR